MPRYVALLRGVSPMNASMPALKAAFENAGFTDVKTIISSGNVAFNTRTTPIAALERKCEAALQGGLGRSFLTIVRPSKHLAELLGSDPFAAHGVPEGNKRIVTFLREAPEAGLELPAAIKDGAILCVRQQDVLSTYPAGDTGGALARLLEKTFGAAVTSRTWDTVRKCAAA